MIKNPSVLRYGYCYEFKRGQVSAYSTNPKRYRFAMPAKICEGSTPFMGDCWITDKNGTVDPGLSCSPVPVCADSLKNGRYIGRTDHNGY